MGRPPPADENLIRELRERIKELECSYAVSAIAATPKTSLAQVIRSIANIIPSAFQSPGSLCARITIGRSTTQTANFRKCLWRFQADIVANEEVVGKLEVGHLGQAAPGRSPFLKEEEKLLQDIAKRIGLVVHRKALEDSLRESERRYRNIVDNSLVGIFQITLDGQFLYANDIFVRMLGYGSFADLAAVSPRVFYQDPTKRTMMIDRLRKKKRFLSISYGYDPDKSFSDMLWYTKHVGGEPWVWQKSCSVGHWVLRSRGRW